jgi:hypothetical protein
LEDALDERAWKIKLDTTVQELIEQNNELDNQREERKEITKKTKRQQQMKKG